MISQIARRPTTWAYVRVPMPIIPGIQWITHAVMRIDAVETRITPTTTPTPGLTREILTKVLLGG